MVKKMQLNLFNNNYRSYGYESASSVQIRRINEIRIKNFRNLSDKTIKIGKRITIIAGRNATNKTSILGMLAHPFNTDKKDCFGKELKTKMSKVFRMSPIYDKTHYVYDLSITDINGRIITESFHFFIRPKAKSFRVFPLKRTKGDGFFSYNTTFLGLSRLTPIVDTDTQVSSSANLTKKEIEEMQLFYQQILPSRNHSSFEGVQDKKHKETFGPAGENREYDFNTISSGEDILGAIFNKIITFQRAKSSDPNKGNGIFCIDEIEASLHPSAQVALFKFLLSWSRNNNIQIAFTTHSLHLINTIYNSFQNLLDSEDIIINFLSKSDDKGDRNYPILINPPKNIAYNELTLLDPSDNQYKINLFCEDECAKTFITALLSETILEKLEIVTHTNKNQKGTSWDALKNLCTTYESLIKDSIIVFDADVGKNQNAIKQLQKPNINYCFLPDEDHFPLEKRIAIYLCSMSPASFKEEFGISLDLILSNLAAYHLCANEEKLRQEKNITKFKNWAIKDPHFTRYVQHYAKSLDDSFSKTMIDLINKIYQRQGLPVI